VRTLKLSQYAKEQGVKYAAVWNWYRKGLISGVRTLPSGKLVIDLPDSSTANSRSDEIRVVLYARTSSSQNKKCLDDQLRRLEQYAASRGYKVIRSVKELGSGLSDTRPGLTSILSNIELYDKIVVECKDRLARFGFNWFQLFTKNKIEVINELKTETSEVTDDLVEIIHHFASNVDYIQKKKKMLIEIMTDDSV